MGVTFKHPRGIPGFTWGESLVWKPGKTYIEKTIAGSIAHFEDGAKDVPLKKLVCTIAPSLEGVSSVEVIQTGTNLCDGDFVVGWIANDGTYHSDFTDRIATTKYYPVVGGQSYYFMCDKNWRYCFYDENFATIDRANSYTAPRVIQSPANAKYVRFASPETSVEYYCCNYPSSITTKQPYSTPLIKTLSLGQTIYGGTVDAVTGEGKKTWKQQIAGNFHLWQYHSKGYFYVIDAYAEGKASGQNNIIGEDLTTINTSQLTTVQYSICGRTQDGAIYVYLTGNETLEEFHQWIDSKKISFELETPEDFTTLPITPTPETALGANNFWNDVGDTSVTYYADPDITPPLLSMLPPPTNSEPPINEEDI